MYELQKQRLRLPPRRAERQMARLRISGRLFGVQYLLRQYDRKLQLLLRHLLRYERQLHEYLLRQHEQLLHKYLLRQYRRQPSELLAVLLRPLRNNRKQLRMRMRLHPLPGVSRRAPASVLSAAVPAPVSAAAPVHAPQQ